MKEEGLQKLMQDSLVKTSDGFTDKLMDSIEAQCSRRKTRYYFVPALIACVFLFLLLTQLAVHFTVGGFVVRLPAMAVRVVGVVVVFVLVNQLIALRGRLRGV